MLLGACASGRAAPPSAVGEPPGEPAPPAVSPVVHVRAARLVPYPGLEVAYVDGAGVECFHYRGVYYMFSKGNWFYARSLDGAWAYVEMKYVPPDLFRVRGHRPPQLEGRPIPPPPAPIEEY
jgi:hypothetical protein